MKDVLKVCYDKEEDCFSYSIEPNKLSTYPIDDLYRILGELLCLLGEVYDIIGRKKDETRRAIK